ncbi:E3 UBIQUITIN-PROTEIN LIGASE RNF5-RELATED [Salix koriyanagi]|uniref:E3 ubiquitin-protein ligase RMA n=1 Tax=Salix koriyanagi TaxID=2511006 RepID=A0A9Q0TQB6_9ROSI|nr:E3 UBIQUITIN-PROTEIN LIGASE RNF5-RELATED [Salix koriyanagi]
MDLDLNEEPLYSSNDSLLGLATMWNELETTNGLLEERIRQLEAVTFRARQRQRWRQNHITPQTGGISVEPATINVRSEGGLLIGEASVATEERRDEMNKFGKRNSAYLLAKALGRNENGKEARSDRSVFDCNVCLDMAQDPILTCCGHLFCWSCFYQLSYVYSNVKECLVCMEEVADTSIIPIYGNGNTNDNNKLKSKESGLKVPPRPSAQRVESMRQQLINRGVFSSSIEERMRHFGNVLIAMGEIPRSDDLEDTPLESERTSFLANQVSTSQALPSTGAEVSRHNHSVQVSRLLFQGAASLSSFSSAVNSAMNSAVESAERLVEDLEAVLHNHGGRRNHQQSSRPADRDSFSSIAAVIQPDSQNLDTVADADSMLPHSASSSRPDDAAIASQFESRSMGNLIESNSTAPISSSSSRRNLVSRLSEVDISLQTNPSSSRRRIEVSRVSDADNGHNREHRRRRLN